MDPIAVLFAMSIFAPALGANEMAPTGWGARSGPGEEMRVLGSRTVNQFGRNVLRAD